MPKFLLIIFTVISVAVVVLFSVLYYAFGEKSKITLTKRITYCAVLTAMATVLNIFTVDTGVKYFVLSFAVIPCVIGGFLLSPVEGFSIGFLGDLLGALIHPLGAYMPLIGIASGLWGLLAGCITRIGKEGKIYTAVKIVISFIFCIFICTAFLNTYSLYVLYGNGRTFWAYLIIRFPMQSLVAVINCAICVILTQTLVSTPYIKNKFNV